MKRILIFSVAYHPFIGGAEIAVKEITDRLSSLDKAGGFEFHMFTVNLDGRQSVSEKVGNIYVHRIGSGSIGKYLFPFLAARKALSLHREKSFDAIWSIMANYAGFAALFFKMRRPSIPFILTLQEGDPISYIKRQVWFVYPLFVQIFRRADIVQTISNYLVDFARNMGAKAPIHVIPNGVDVSLFAREYPTGELEALKQEIGKNPGDIFLITTSRLVVKNGVGDVIRSLLSLPANVKFLILGIGPLESHLKNLVQKLGLSNRVKFLGFVPHTEIPKYLKISDIFIRPSLSEGMGNSFIEAMAAGIPVIATPVGGIPDFLRDPSSGRELVTGLFCEVKNPKSIAEKVSLILSDANLRETIIANGKKLAIEKYDWDIIAEKMNVVFLD